MLLPLTLIPRPTGRPLGATKGMSRDSRVREEWKEGGGGVCLREGVGRGTCEGAGAGAGRGAGRSELGRRRVRKTCPLSDLIMDTTAFWGIPTTLWLFTCGRRRIRWKYGDIHYIWTLYSYVLKLYICTHELNDW